MPKKFDPSFIEDLTEKLERAKSMSFVLADAAAGDLGIEADNVKHVSLMIAQEIEQALKLIEATQQRRVAA